MMNFLDNLLPPDRNTQHGMGALPRSNDPRDYHLELIPEVAAQLEAGLPSSFLCLPLESVPYIYDQNGYGACVAASTAGVKSIEDFKDVGRWNRYDWMELYTACGGRGDNGILTDTALQYTRDIGCLELGSGKRWKIQSYYFAPQVWNAWRQTIAAALVSSGPCVVATLLPARFGWDSDEQATSGYHQMAIIGWEGLGDTDNVILMNSWGAGWANKGFGRLRWRYLEGNNFQSRYVYAYKLLDVDDPNPIPDPEPDPDPEPLPGTRPTIMEIWQKHNRLKAVVQCKDTHPDAVLFYNGKQSDAGFMRDRFVLKLQPGKYTFMVKNPDGLESAPVVFTVVEP